MPLLLQVLAEFAIVVNLPVHDGNDTPGFIRDRLPAALRIDDAQTADAERDPAIAKTAVLVRSPMHQSLQHPIENLGIALTAMSAYAAHRSISLRLGRRAGRTGSRLLLQLLSAHQIERLIALEIMNVVRAQEHGEPQGQQRSHHGQHHHDLAEV